jgi:carbon starvation protein
MFSAALADGKVLTPAKSAADMQAIVLNDTVDAALCAVFIAVVLAMLFYGVAAVRRAVANPKPTTQELGYDLQLVR